LIRRSKTSPAVEPSAALHHCSLHTCEAAHVHSSHSVGADCHGLDHDAQQHAAAKATCTIEDDKEEAKELVKVPNGAPTDAGNAGSLGKACFNLQNVRPVDVSNFKNMMWKVSALATSFLCTSKSFQSNGTFNSLLFFLSRRQFIESLVWAAKFLTGLWILAS